MNRLEFWLHMDADYMWRWYCTSPVDGMPIAKSGQYYFAKADAEAALKEARSGMALQAAN